MTALNLEPASAVAAGKCLMSRIWKPGMAGGNPDAYHPRPCAWEDFTRQELVHMLDDFNAAAGYDARHERYHHVDAERFHALPRSEQARLVRLAQYPDAEERAA
jgi:hypothetical protein